MGLLDKFHPKTDIDNRMERLFGEARDVINASFNKHTLPTIQVHEVSLKPEEFAILYEEKVASVGFHTERIGESTGGSVRLMRGLWIRKSAYHSVPVEKMGINAIGSLILTNQRLVYLSDKQIANMPWKDILSIDTDMATMDVALTNKPKPYKFFMANPCLWTFLAKYVQQIKPPTPQLDGDVQLEVVRNGDNWQFAMRTK